MKMKPINVSKISKKAEACGFDEKLEVILGSNFLTEYAKDITVNIKKFNSPTEDAEDVAYFATVLLLLGYVAREDWPLIREFLIENGGIKDV